MLTALEIIKKSGKELTAKRFSPSFHKFVTKNTKKLVGFGVTCLCFYVSLKSVILAVNLISFLVDPFQSSFSSYEFKTKFNEFLILKCSS